MTVRIGYEEEERANRSEPVPALRFGQQNADEYAQEDRQNEAEGHPEWRNEIQHDRPACEF